MTTAEDTSVGTAERLLEVAARLLAEGGESAVSARKVTSEAGVSTIGVYTHYGSMDGLLAAVWREGFLRFGVELERAALTDDPVADWMCQAWGYRHFALSEPHLYAVMFGRRLRPPVVPPEDNAVAIGTFESLVRRLQRCADAGRFSIDDPIIAAHVVWAGVHGHMTLELRGDHRHANVDPVAIYEASILHGALGFGDEPDAARSSRRTARRRARRAGQLDAPRGEPGTTP